MGSCPPMAFKSGLAVMGNPRPSVRPGKAAVTARLAGIGAALVAVARAPGPVGRAAAAAALAAEHFQRNHEWEQRLKGLRSPKEQAPIAPMAAYGHL